jgi:hypothetical protein
MTTESGDEHKAGKPLSVRIVEWLGWTYVALGVWVLIFNVFWGLWGIVNPLQAGIWFLAIFVGVPLCLVWALRQGLRGGSSGRIPSFGRFCPLVPLLTVRRG